MILKNNKFIKGFNNPKSYYGGVGVKGRVIFFSQSSVPLRKNLKRSTFYWKNLFILDFQFLFMCLFVIYILYSALVVYSYFNSYEGIYSSCVIPSGSSDDSVPMDPVRWWPSGVPQSAAIIASGLAVFKTLQSVSKVSPQLRVLASLAAAGATGTNIAYHSAKENPLGFNRFMWGLSEYNKTGTWPSLDSIKSAANDSVVNAFVENTVKSSDSNTVEKIISEVTSNSNNFLPSSNFVLDDFISKYIEFVFQHVVGIIHPIYVQGHLDDLIGQRFFIQILLFILCILTIILFLIFISNLIFILNKD